MATKVPLSSRINAWLSPFVPSLALQREKAQLQRRMLVAGMAHYDVAGASQRSRDFRRNRTDAVEAARHDRMPISLIARDMQRNNPRVVKAERAVLNNVIGPGIVPAVKMVDPEDGATKARIEGLIKAHLMTRSIDAAGRLNIYGLQALALGTTFLSGEVLIRKRQRRPSDGLPLNFQIQLLEPDFLDERVDGPQKDGYAVQGIQFDRIGRRTGYHVYREHPGGARGVTLQSTLIPEAYMLHMFDLKRPGQERGVPWLAPVMTLLHELQKYQDGQVKRQEIAALFAAVFKSTQVGEEIEQEIGELSAGSVLTIGSDEEMEFTNPPAVDGYETFMQVTDRVIAAALGLTYEGFTGDYSRVNFSSGRMGRLDTEPTVQQWQRNLMIAQFLDPLGDWVKEAIEDVADIPRETYAIEWTPPTRPMIDPTKELAAHRLAVRAGFNSRRAVVRETGRDPLAVEAEIDEERAWARERDVVLDTDPGQVSVSGVSNDGHSDGNGNGGANEAPAGSRDSN